MSGESLINIESLPDELLLAILVHVPAQDIINGAMLVCKKWYRFINSVNFVIANLQHSPPGLLVQCYCDQRKRAIFMAMQLGRITTSELNFKFNSYATSSCNGLIVDPTLIGSNPTIYVVNPATQQRCPFRLSHQPSTYSCAVMAYDAASMKYKMVVMYSCDETTSVQSCAILTVGDDVYWRGVHTEHLSITAAEFCIDSPVIAGGFIHWPETQGSTRVLTLNVETEVFTLNLGPQGYEGRSKYYLSTGKCLTMLVACSDLWWDVWELKREECGGWMKVFKIDLEAQKWRIKELVPRCYHCNFTYNKFYIHEHDGLQKIMTLKPVGWLDYGEVLVLHASTPSRLFFLYNVRTRRIDSFQLNHNCDLSRFQFHRNSLVRLIS